MGLLNWLFDSKETKENKQCLAEDKEDPLLNEQEAAVAERCRRGNRIAFWQWLRHYKVELWRLNVRQGVCDDDVALSLPGVSSSNTPPPSGFGIGDANGGYTNQGGDV